MYFYEELSDRDKEILLTAIQDMNGKTMLRFAHSHNVYLPSEAWEEPDILRVRLIGWFYTDISENFEDIEVKYKNKYFIDDTYIYFMDGHISLTLAVKLQLYCTVIFVKITRYKISF